MDSAFLTGFRTTLQLMGGYLVLIFTVTLASCGTFQKSNPSAGKAQYISLAKTGNDTTLYVQHNFINGKSKYIGKPLRVLLEDLEIPIVSYILDPPVQKVFKGPWTYSLIALSPYTQQEASKRFNANKKPVRIFISGPNAFQTHRWIVYMI
jgi:hypothetical protein